MDRINEEQGVAIGTVPKERVQALRDQLSAISETIKCARVVVVSKHTTPNSSRASSLSHIIINSEKRAGVFDGPICIDGEFEARGETDSAFSNVTFLTAPQLQSRLHSEDRDDGVCGARIDRCHITELEFELTRAREEESRAKKRVLLAKGKREGIEERLVKMRRLWELRKV